MVFEIRDHFLVLRNALENVTAFFQTNKASPIRISTFTCGILKKWRFFVILSWENKGFYRNPFEAGSVIRLQIQFFRRPSKRTAFAESAGQTLQ